MEPPPEPLQLTDSPEPEIPSCHDNYRKRKADIMSALGESVSFGRFFLGERSHVEEAAMHARPGSVAQKKAFFEARIASRRKKRTAAAADDDGGGGGLEAAAAVEEEEQVAGAVLESPEKKKPTAVCSSNLVAAGDAIEKQPLKERSIINNQDITDSAKKRRIQMSSGIIPKPIRFRSPPSGKKGQSSSVKRLTTVTSAKEGEYIPRLASQSQYRK